MQKILAITNYNIKSLIRNFRSSAILFILPAFFILIFGIVFRSNSEQDVYDIGIVQADNAQYEAYINGLKNLEGNSTNNEKLFNVSEFEQKENATKAVEDDEILLYIMIKDSKESSYNLNIDTFGEPTSQTYFQIAGIIEQYTADFLEINTDFFNSKIITQDIAEEELSPFDLLTPGLMVYSMLILIPGVAERFSKIRENGQLFRYQISKVKSFHIIGGSLIFFSGISVIQLLISLATAYFFGFRPEGSVLDGMLVAFTTSFFVTGLGILFGTLANNSEEATNLGSLFSIILGFLSGSFVVGVGNLFEFEVLGLTLQFNDFLPSKWATQALENIFTSGESLITSIEELSIIFISGIIILTLSSIIYHYKHFRSK